MTTSGCRFFNSGPGSRSTSRILDEIREKPGAFAATAKYFQLGGYMDAHGWDRAPLFQRQVVFRTNSASPPWTTTIARFIRISTRRLTGS
jgi:hypothetical protein